MVPAVPACPPACRPTRMLLAAHRGLQLDGALEQGLPMQPVDDVLAVLRPHTREQHKANVSRPAVPCSAAATTATAAREGERVALPCD